MTTNEGVNSSSSRTQQHFVEEPLFTPCTIGTLVVVSVATAAFAVLAGFHILYPISAYAAFGLGGAAVLFIAIRYITQESCSFHRAHEDELPPLPSLRVPRLTEEAWRERVDLATPRLANLIDGTENVAELSESGLYQRPYFGNYDTNYRSIYGNTKANWRLPPSQLAAFPEEMQRNFAQDGENGNLDLFFISIKDTEAAGARNIIMHPLAIPEYNNQQHYGLACNVEMRIYEPHGIVQHPNRYAATPFGNQGYLQQAHFHRSPQREISAISPNNARFVIQRGVDYSSFYVGTRFRGRACVFYVVIDRVVNSEWEGLLDRSNTLTELRTNLALSNFPYKDNIDRLLRSY